MYLHFFIMSTLRCSKVNKCQREDWRIYNTTPIVDNNSRSPITDRGIRLPSCDRSKYVSLSIPTNMKLEKFQNPEYKGSKLNHILQLTEEIYSNIKGDPTLFDPKVDIISKINKVIPDKFFGCYRNRKSFFAVVKKLLTRSMHECVLIRSLVRNFKFEKVPWMKGFDKQKHINYFYFPLKWVIDCVKYLILKNYHFLKSSYPYEIQLVPHNSWSRYKQRVFSRIILKRKYAIPVDVPSNQVRGVLDIIPKDGLKIFKFRPILRLHKSLCKLPNKKFYNQIIYNEAKKLSKTKTENFYGSWCEYVKKMGCNQFYCVKADVTDAYGNINIDNLTYLINKMTVALPTKKELLKHVQEQYITFRNPNRPKTQVYQWTHGLLQGDRLSGAFCALNMSYLDYIYLFELYKSNNFIYRSVDDYLFVSTDQKEAEKFLKMMKRAHTLKLNKILSNVPLRNCTQTEQILYCGFIIDMKTYHIRPSFNIRPNTSLHTKFRIWNENMPVDHKNFVIKAMRYHYNNYYFGKVFLNTIYNAFQTTLFNYFEAMVNLAHKFDVAVSAIYNRKEYKVYGAVLGQVVIDYAKKALQTLKKNCDKSKGICITFAMLVKVGYAAFYVVLRKKCAYGKIVREIDKMNRSIHVNRPFDIKDYMKLPKSFVLIRMARKMNIVNK